MYLPVFPSEIYLVRRHTDPQRRALDVDTRRNDFASNWWRKAKNVSNKKARATRLKWNLSLVGAASRATVGVSLGSGRKIKTARWMQERSFLAPHFPEQKFRYCVPKLSTMVKWKLETPPSSLRIQIKMMYYLYLKSLPSNPSFLYYTINHKTKKLTMPKDLQLSFIYN